METFLNLESESEDESREISPTITILHNKLTQNTRSTAIYGNKVKTRPNGCNIESSQF